MSFRAVCMQQSGVEWQRLYTAICRRLEHFRRDSGDQREVCIIPIAMIAVAICS